MRYSFDESILQVRLTNWTRIMATGRTVQHLPVARQSVPTVRRPQSSVTPVPQSVRIAQSKIEALRRKWGAK